MRTLHAPASPSRFQRLLGTGLHVLFDGVELDLTAAERSVTISRGRSGATGQAASTTCQLRFTGLADPVGMDLAAPVTVYILPAALAAAGVDVASTDDVYRSRGTRVTDLDRTVDPGSPTATAVTGTGPLSRLGRVTIGDQPWPAETDAARAARIGALTPEPFAVLGRAMVNVDRQDVDSRDALGLLDELAQDTGGYLYESRLGVVTYLTAAGRLARAPELTLGAEFIQAPTRFSKTLDGLVNDLRITRDQATIAQATDPGSSGRFGRFDASRSVTLIGASDAQRIADRIVRRWAYPTWLGEGITVDLLQLLDLGQGDLVAQLLALDVGALVELTGLPDGAPAPELRVWVEGIKETISGSRWLLTLSAVPYELLGDGISWDQVPEDISWADAAALGLTWRTARSWWPL